MQGIKKDYECLYGENAEEAALQLKSECGYALCGGVQYLHRSYVRSDKRPVETYILVVPASSPVRVSVWGMPQGQSAIVPEQVQIMQNQGINVVAAVNAGFFHFFNNGDKTTYGAQIIDGVVHKEPSHNERIGANWFGVTTDGEYVISNVEGYEKKYRGKLSYAVGGGDIIYRDNEPYLGGDPELHPRTAVGIAEDGTVIIVCVDGRMEKSVGVSLVEVLQIFFDLGYTYTSILNLDGGGSTIMMGKTVDGKMEILNTPCTGVDNLRPVADMVTLILP